MLNRQLKHSQVAMITPMHPDGAIDWAATDKLVEWHIHEGSSGLVPVGTTGESPTLSPAEHKEFVSYVTKAVAGRIPVIAGAGSNSTAETIEFAKHAAEAGCDAVLLVVPYYNKPTQQGLLEHYTKVATEVAVPQIIYNVPSRTVTDILPETVAALAKQKNIIGIKEATGDVSRVQLLREKCGADFLLLSGDDLTLCDFILAGGDGCISVTANVVPGLIDGLCALGSEGAEAEARALHDKLQALNRALFAEVNPIPVKYALALMGKCQAGIRLPLTELSPAQRPQLEAALRELQLLD